MENTSTNTLKILKAAFSFSIFLYAGLCFAIENKILMDGSGFPATPDASMTQMYLVLFSGMAFMSLMAQFILPPKIKVESNASIIRYALCESIAIFGLVLYLMTSLWIPAAVLMGVSLFTLLFLDRRAQAAI